MAAELVGGAFLSAFLQVLFDRIASPEVVNFIRGKKLNEKLIKKLKIKLHTVNAVLHDAENKQIRNPAVKEWLDDLEDAVFDADDLLDEIATRARRKSKRKVRNPFSTSINSYQRKIGEVLHRLEFIAKQKKYLGLKEDVGGKLSPKTPTTSLVEESNVYGRDDEKEAIIKLLLSDDVGGSKICVIPIVGMGGIGKTTLAQFAYNDDRVEEKFDLKAWVCVSEEFGVLKVTKMVLEAVTSYACEINDLNLLQLKLKERLTGKKFLLVLDDIWSDNYVDWHSLQSPFQYGALGSKIIMTTRNEKVALIMQTVPAYHLRHLSNEDCWLLFANHAFNNSKVDPNLEIVGREIVKRCRGLPLAAKALGGLLRWKSDVEDWNAILKSDIWNLPEYESNVLPALQLSYHHLPSNLKRCFAYCAIFPKGYEFRKEELILLWMAENFLQSPTRNKRMEDVGDEYFHDLVSRSFLQQSSSDNSCFIMHDLIHDLAKHIAGKLCFMLEDDEAQVIAKRTRHLSYSNFITGNWTFMNFGDFFASKNLRTFLVLCPQFSSHIFPFHVKITHDLLPNLRFLRVLSLSRYNAIETLPDSIGGLILLRYLDISFTKIKKLPESLSTLYNLQSLKLLMCYCLTMLPRNIHNCINMRYIDISRTPLQEMPRQMSKLKSLQFLSHFVVGRERGSKIGELGELSDLRGTLSIEKLQNVLNSKDASEAKVKDKKYLEELKLKWDLYASRGDSLHERDILDKLQPDTYLKRLSIFGYGGARFPDWLGHGSYHNMVSLCLYGCRNCSLLPPLGQLTSLKCLQIMSFENIVTVGQEFYSNGYLSMKKPFLSLETLSFYEMLSWQQWFSFEVEGEVGPFPNLRELCVVDCPRLTGDLPIFLPSLTRLEITNCQQLTSSLPRTPEIRELQVIPYPEVALKQLDFKGCRLLESLFEAMTLNETCLERLSISGCSSSMAFPHGCLPTSMKKLDIAYCEKLEFPMNRCPKALVSLSVKYSCSSLTDFPLSIFPNLKYLFIKGCANLTSLSAMEGSLQHLNHLSISNCPNFVSFPKRGLPLPCLTEFWITDCKKLKSLPEQMSLLTVLETLCISDCPEIDSFPKGGLPSNLGTLSISSCDKLTACWINWDSTSLTSLKYLCVHCKCENMTSFPEEGLLPAGLTSVSISGLVNLQSLDSNGLQYLTSLKQLSVVHCPRLESLTGLLPRSLVEVNIMDCPLLEKQCSKEKGEDWLKIAHDPNIRISGKLIS